MQENAWYLVAYDIADPRRLQRLHRRLRRDGVPMQKSVFLVRSTRGGIARLIDELAGLMHKYEDDLRAYPVHDPGDIWLRGKGVTDGNLLRPGRSDPVADTRPLREDERAEEPPKRGWWRRLFARD